MVSKCFPLLHKDRENKILDMDEWLMSNVVVLLLDALLSDMLLMISITCSLPNCFTIALNFSLSYSSFFLFCLPSSVSSILISLFINSINFASLTGVHFFYCFLFLSFTQAAFIVLLLSSQLHRIGATVGFGLQ